MPIQRTVRDVHALCLEQKPTTEYSEGDTAVISNRGERLAEYSWVTEDDGEYKLTETGAAIVNHFNRLREDGELVATLENGAGNFVDDAVTSELHEHEFGGWHVVEHNKHEVVMERSCDCGEMEEKLFTEPPAE